MIVLFKISSGSISAVIHQILSKSDNIFTEIWWFNDFQNGGRGHHVFLKFAVFVTWLLSACDCASSYKISLKSDNRTIGWWLWPKKRFSTRRPTAIKKTLACKKRLSNLQRVFPRSLDTQPPANRDKYGMWSYVYLTSNVDTIRDVHKMHERVWWCDGVIANGRGVLWVTNRRSMWIDP